MGKKECEICQNNAYSGKYAQHLKNQHPKTWATRHLIKDVVKYFTDEELEEVKELVLKIKERSKID